MDFMDKTERAAKKAVNKVERVFGGKKTTRRTAKTGTRRAGSRSTAARRTGGRATTSGRAGKRVRNARRK